ncbi:hypothetical protein DXG01_015088, partial [Tephrocybe rancida]
CIIPVFDGLLPDEEMNSHILHLLFLMAHWHGLAKLRLHSTPTLDLLNETTTTLGDTLRKFKIMFAQPSKLENYAGKQLLESAE